VIHTIHADISLAASRHPQNVAIWEEQTSLSYAELEQCSNALAYWLTQQFPDSGHRIALVMPKSIDAVVAIIAILKSGNTYVPLGDTWSSGRLEKIFLDGQFALVITDSDDRNLAIESERLLVANSAQWKQAVTDSQASEFKPVEVDQLASAYMLYTSGSTGTPKGVSVSHRAARHFPAWACVEFELTDTDKVASVSPLTFDLTTFDLFSTLATGATLYIVPEKLKVFPARLSEFLQQHAITFIYAVPSTLTLLLQRGKLETRDLSAMKTVLFAGEEFPVPLFQQFRNALPDHIEYANLYGPTETNVCTYYRVPANFDLDRMPIGRALPDTHLFTRNTSDNTDKNDDENSRGELCVAGPTVMSGYYGHNDSNANYWLPDPRGVEHRAYATGDQVSLRTDDIWDYHGRVDTMVKIWGYRVELGEVESCLNAMTNVEQAAVVKVSDNKSAGGDSLMAFIRLRDAQSVSTATDNFQKEAILHCRENLPPYMVPREFRVVDNFPLSNNGKIDRLALEKTAIE